MFLLRKPSPDAIRAFLDRSRALPFSYSAKDMVSNPPPGFDVDEHVVSIGHGREAFDRARRALMDWKQFDFAWVELVRSRAVTDPGMDIAVLIRHLGLWSINGGRVISFGDGTGVTPSFGLSYGTLSNHAECGEELFEVFLDPRTDDVMYRIRAVSRPRAAIARLGRPVVRVLQGRFRRDSAAAMKRATGGLR